MSAARPSRMARVSLGFWLFEAALALVLALPVRAVVERAYGQHPDGDAVLFRDGALELTELVYRFDPATSLLPSLLAVTVVLTAVVGHLPLAAAIAFLDERADWAKRAVASFWRMLVVFVSSLLLRGLVLGAGLALAFWLSGAQTLQRGEVSAFRWGIAAFAPFLLVLWALAVLTDYAYVAVVRTHGLRPALVQMVRAIWPRKAAPLFFYGASLAVQLALLAAGAMVAGSLGGKGGIALVVLFIAHQLVQVGRMVVRVRWLAYVIDKQPTPE
jgi:hypothetical protein